MADGVVFRLGENGGLNLSWEAVMKTLTGFLLVGLVVVSNVCFAGGDDGIRTRKEVMAYQRTLASPDFNIHYSTPRDVSGKYGKPSRESKIENYAPHGLAYEDKFQIVWYYDSPTQTTVYVFSSSAGRAIALEDKYIAPSAKYVATKERD